MLKSLALSFVLVTLASCVVAGPGPAGPDTGDVAFDWSFDGETHCAAADVEDLDVVITDADTGEIVLDDRAEPCSGSGLVVPDILEGSYDVDITAFDHAGDAIYAGSFSVDIIGGTTADAGVVTLDPVGP